MCTYYMFTVYTIFYCIICSRNVFRVCGFRESERTQTLKASLFLWGGSGRRIANTTMRICGVCPLGWYLCWYWLSHLPSYGPTWCLGYWRPKFVASFKPKFRGAKSRCLDFCHWNLGCEYEWLLWDQRSDITWYKRCLSVCVSFWVGSREKPDSRVIWRTWWHRPSFYRLWLEPTRGLLLVFIKVFEAAYRSPCVYPFDCNRDVAPWQGRLQRITDSSVVTVSLLRVTINALHVNMFYDHQYSLTFPSRSSSS